MNWKAYYQNKFYKIENNTKIKRSTILKKKSKNLLVFCHNGKAWNKFKINETHNNRKIGEFFFTRKYVKYNKK